MTYEEELEWGQKEYAQRIVELSVRTPGGLRTAQDNAEARRRAAGLSRNRAAALVIAARREICSGATKNARSDEPESKCESQ